MSTPLKTGKSSDIQAKLNNTMSFGLRGALRDMQERYKSASASLHEIVGLAEREDRGLSAAEKLAFERGRDFCNDLKARIEKEQEIHASLTGGARQGSDLSEFEGRVQSPGVREFRRGESVTQAWIEHRGGREYEADRDRIPWEQIGLGGWLRARVCGPSNDLERRALAEGGEGAELVPDILSPRLIDAVRARSVALRAGAQTVLLDSDKHEFARLDEDNVPGWRNEAGDVSEDDAGFSRVTFIPRSIAVLTKSSFELLADGINVRQAIERALVEGIAGALDKAVFEGSGTPPEPQGLRTATGLQTIDMNDSSLTSYDKILDLLEMLEAANVIVDADGVERLHGNQRALENSTVSMVVSPNTARTLRGFKEAETLAPLAAPAIIAAIPRFVSTRISENFGTGTDETWLALGDFSSVAVGIRQQIRIETLKERFSDKLQIGFLAHMRADVQLWHPASMGRVTEITTT